MALVLFISTTAVGQEGEGAGGNYQGLGREAGESPFMTGKMGLSGTRESGRPVGVRLNPPPSEAWALDLSEGSYQNVAANSSAWAFPDSFNVSFPEDRPESYPEIASNDRIFFRGWVLITSVEVVLLAVTALMPKEWTGWSSTFVKDGWGNMQDAYSSPPVWDTDHWFHNFIGHPYGGNVYYNTVRSQGARKGQSFLFSLALSLQWEYIFEAVAEQPSIQDLLITPVIGSLLGEFVHMLTATFKKNGTSLPEKIIMTILNPTGVWYNGYD